MFRRRSREREPVPTGEQVAAQMRKYAGIFVESMAVDGFSFDWDPSSAHKLDGVCVHFLGEAPSEDEVRAMTVAMGAYLGELIVRNGGARWVFHGESGAAVDLGDGRLCFPHTKVSKRLELGDEHGLWAFYEFAVTGEVPPGAQAGPV
jgi:hypothetical protein